MQKQFITLLQSYVPTLEEHDYKERMMSFVHEYDRCFDRSLAVGHITASAWLLNTDSSKALLMHHRKLDKWMQPGGHCDGDADVLKVAIKEAQEESGILHIEPVSHDIFDIDIHLIPETESEKAHYHYDVRFLVQAVDDDTLKQNKESKALQWFGKEDELPTKERSVVRMHEKWHNNHAIPRDYRNKTVHTHL